MSVAVHWDVRWSSKVVLSVLDGQNLSCEVIRQTHVKSLSVDDIEDAVWVAGVGMAHGWSWRDSLS